MIFVALFFCGFKNNLYIANELIFFIMKKKSVKVKTDLKKFRMSSRDLKNVKGGRANGDTTYEGGTLDEVEIIGTAKMM